MLNANPISEAKKPFFGNNNDSERGQISKPKDKASQPIYKMYFDLGVLWPVVHSSWPSEAPPVAAVDSRMHSTSTAGATGRPAGQ